MMGAQAGAARSPRPRDATWRSARARRDVLRISQDIDKSRYARSLPLTPRARKVLDAICEDEGLIFRRFEYRRMLGHAARKVLGTEHEAKHLSAHDFRHAVQSLAEPEFWTPKWTPLPAKRPKSVHRYDLSFRNHWVGHPGLEPGANGLRIHCSTT